MKLNNLESFVNQRYSWINPVIIFITTASSSVITYSFPSEFQTKHPIQYEVLNPVLENIGWVFYPAVLILCFITWVEIKSRKICKEYEVEIEEHKLLSETISENIKELFNGFLYRFSISKANFTSKERVTLYIHNGDGLFIPFGRYSLNVKYAKSGRSKYPDDEGCISKGWEDKWHFNANLSNPNEKGNNYLNEHKEQYSVDKSVTKNLRMKSTLYAVLRLDVKHTPIAVVVVESTDNDKYTEEQIKGILEEQEHYLAEMIFNLNKYIPKPSNAKLIEGL